MKRFHQICPKQWRHTEYRTGDYDFDASLARSKNPDGQSKLDSHISGSQGYGYRTNYRGYSGLSGDD